MERREWSRQGAQGKEQEAQGKGQRIGEVSALQRGSLFLIVASVFLHCGSDSTSMK